MRRVALKSLPVIANSEAATVSINNSKHLMTMDELTLRQQGTALHEILRQVGEGIIPLPDNLNTPRAQWIFNSKHREAHNEYALTGIIDNTLVHVVLDRTFIDEQDRRWIIDYKFSSEIDCERYQPQLEKYAKLLRYRESREIRLGLFSPIANKWFEWRYAF